MVPYRSVVPRYDLPPRKPATTIEFHSGSIFERRWYMMRESHWCIIDGESEAPSSKLYSETARASIILSICW